MEPAQLVDELKRLVEGDVEAAEEVREKYSHDTSLFEVRPEVVVYPKSVSDIGKLVKYVWEHKQEQPNLSLTARSGGSDMSGGAINDSIIVDVSRYLKKVGEIKEEGTKVESGVFYRDFEKKTLAKGVYFPSYPASKHLAGIGGIVSNNSGGEKTLEYGQTVDYVKRVRVVLVDGEEHSFGKLTKEKLEKKKRQEGFEGEVYRKVFKLVDENYERIMRAKPKVSKNSTGYNLWNVWDKGKGEFNLGKLFVGAQGTLGVVTGATLELVPTREYGGLLVLYLQGLDKLPEIINEVLETKPQTFESFDEHTMKLALKFIPQFMMAAGVWGSVGMGFQFVPNLWMFATKGIPKITLLVEYEGDTQGEVDKKIDELAEKMRKYGIKTSKAKRAAEAERYKMIRRESFNLLRKNISGNVHTAPFIDDLIVPPEKLPEFFPKLKKIMEDYELKYTIAGHMGDGNFHVIPLMDLSIDSEREKLKAVGSKVYGLVLKFGGSTSAEHNEGMVRGVYLKKMYGKEMFEVFCRVKEIFDSKNIFNPHKKTDASWEWNSKHIRRHF